MSSKSTSPAKQRHRARKLAMQALYQWHYNDTDLNELISTVIQEQWATQFDKAYFELLLKGFSQNKDAIDEAIQLHLDRQLSELNPVELAILRVSAFEMLYQIEIPYRVVINEGVELAKEFGSDQGHKYVNAVLDKLARHHRTNESF